MRTSQRVPALLLVLPVLLAACLSTPTGGGPGPIQDTALPTGAGPAQATAAPTDGGPRPAQGAAYYVRPDGGSAAQCTGLADAPYPGTGTGQPCAWNHPFQALPPEGAPPRIAGGDTLLIAAGSYRMGYGAPGAEACDYDGSYGCHMGPVPSGPDPAHPTRVLGAGWDTGCVSPPELWGTGRPWFIVNLTGSSNAEVACLEITDHSSCIEFHMHPTGGSPLTCERDTPPYGDWAAVGLYAEDAANVYLHDLNIHGLAAGGVQAGRLTDWTVERVRIVGNGSVGWDGDLSGDDANSGTLTFRHWWVAWNGCGETYPEQEYMGCWGQEAGGYGDGVGTGTTGGHWIIEDAAFLHNASDGLDLLYTRLPDAVVEIRRTVAAGNAGNQVKVTGPLTMENVLLVSNCGFFEGLPYWNNADSCRAGGDALALALNPGGQVHVVNSTITGEGGCLAIAVCALERVCDGTERVLMRNTLFQGQPVHSTPGEDACFAWYDDESAPPMPADPFVVEYSLITGVRFGNVNPCPGPGNLCGGPAGLVDPGSDHFDGHLLPGSPAIDAANAAYAPADDLDGRPRDARPDIGAYEWGLESARIYLPVASRVK